jgi:HAD superfamily hydrolase (TIGR01549 family)
VAARAILFDFNGTLSHDEPLLCRIYRELFHGHGRPLSEVEYYTQLAGNAEEAIIAGWLGVEGDELAALVEQRIDRYCALADGSTVTEEARAAVRAAAERVPVGIVSGAYHREIGPVVAAAGLADAVRFVVAADDVSEGKPDPEGYLLAVALLGLDAAEVVAVEDTEAGIASAKAAGLRCVAVRGTMEPARLAAADELVDAVDTALVERLLA